MKHSNGSPKSHPKPASARRRQALLAAFARSGLTAAAFARQHGIQYTTFCGWRQRQAKGSADFVEVDVPPPAAPIEVTVELGAQARMRLRCTDPVELAVSLIRGLNASSPC